ncbi:Deleted in autism protein 1 [Platysternon megacephalum]|uniref:Deleted in autism protein 1 n=1 Tax=Platysternon megacephalum TaxID=55544 RepID=A0A4D9DP00_9SAUR|nr:Deleted in autism protein 1 [Platysternon megacephalum]
MNYTPMGPSSVASCLQQQPASAAVEERPETPPPPMCDSGIIPLDTELLPLLRILWPGVPQAVQKNLSPAFILLTAAGGQHWCGDFQDQHRAQRADGVQVGEVSVPAQGLG